MNVGDNLSHRRENLSLNHRHVSTQKSLNWDMNTMDFHHKEAKQPSLSDKRMQFPCFCQNIQNMQSVLPGGEPKDFGDEAGC